MKSIAITAFLFLAAISTQRAFAEEKVASSALSASGGQFVFGPVSGSGHDCYMLDTKTGRLWALVVTAEKTLALVAVPYHARDRSETVLPPDGDTKKVEEPKNVNSK